MNILFNIYKSMRWLFFNPGEKDEYSAGHIPSMVREEFIDICKEKSGKILEIGCGEGLFLRGLWRKASGLKIFGVDISRKLLLKARERVRFEYEGKASLIECDGQKLCFKEDTFDCVVCLNVLYNLSSIVEVKQIIKEALRVAKKEAEVIVDIRNSRDFLTFLRYKFVKYYDAKIKVPLRQDDLNEIIKILKEDHAKVVEVIPMMTYFKLSKPVFIIRVKKA